MRSNDGMIVDNELQRIGIKGQRPKKSFLLKTASIALIAGSLPQHHIFSEDF
jgi:hypothetical protein